MTDKKTKREIREIIRKYTGEDNRANLAGIGIISGGVTAVGMAMDLLMTGGLFSIGTAMFGGVGGAAALIGARGVISDNIEKTYTNDAGQTLRCSALVNNTLEEMQSRLQEAFKKAATPKTKGKFLRLAAEIQEDVKKLSPAFKIVSGGGHGTDSYEFIVDKDEDITLTEALRLVTQPAPARELSQEERIKKLEAELEALKNPSITKLDKPFHPPSP